VAGWEALSAAPRRLGSQKPEPKSEFVCGEVHESRFCATVSGAPFFAPTGPQLPIYALSPGYPRRTALKKNRRLAGRSASRRMRYGYHADPNGTYVRTR
jgi:hypothetical protein